MRCYTCCVFMTVSMSSWWLSAFIYLMLSFIYVSYLTRLLVLHHSCIFITKTLLVLMKMSSALSWTANSCHSTKKRFQKIHFRLRCPRCPGWRKVNCIFMHAKFREKKLQVSVKKNYFIASLQAREIKLYLSVNSRRASVCLSLISSLAPQLTLR